MAIAARTPHIAQAPPEFMPFQPFGSAVEILYAKEDEVIVDGPAGTGKSRAILEKLHLICSKYEMARVLVVRKTRESLTQSALMTLELFVIPKNGSVTWRTTEQEYRYSNGSRMVVGGLDKSSRIMSTDYDIIYVQEGLEITEDDFEDLTTRARNGVVPYNQVILDCNPGPANHWIKRRWESNKARRIQSYHQDNPKFWDHKRGDWTPAGKVYMKRLSRLSGVRRKRLYLGEWVSVEGQIYEGYTQDTHLIERFTPPEDGRKICTIDFGFRSPFVCQWWYIDEDENMYLYREVYMTNRTVKTHAIKIKELSGKEYIEAYVCDWDAEDRATLEENGIITTQASKAIRVGIEKVQERIKPNDGGKPRIYFMRDSLAEYDPYLEESHLPKSTPEEIEEYVWSNRSAKEGPIQVNDHGMDAMRYGVMYVAEFSRNGGIYT